MHGVSSHKEVIVGSALRQSAVGILGIEHILSTLVVLNPLSAKPSVQFLCRHPQFLGYLRGGVARDAFEHAVGVESLGQQPVDFHILLGYLSVLLPQEHFLLTDELVLLGYEGIFLPKRLAKDLLSLADDRLIALAFVDR
mgnify:CR=1 FL=1